MLTRLRFIGALLLWSTPMLAAAAGQSFSDVPPSSPYFASAEYLRARGVLQGYEDGTFRPNAPVNRAEAIKVIVQQRVTAADMGTASGSVFSDVPSDAWFAPYVQVAYQRLRTIDGPPQVSTFSPERHVTRAEFLKMLYLAYDANPLNSYGELVFPLTDDALSPNDWFYPYVRYALATETISPRDGAVQPGEAISRGDVADMLYRYFLYREGKRTLTLLSITENETLTTLRLLDNGSYAKAQQAAARAIIASRGAVTSQPMDAPAKSAVKTAEAAMALVHAASALAEGDTQKAIEQASTAWHLGEKASSFSSSFEAIVTQVQHSATQLADAARAQ